MFKFHQKYIGRKYDNCALSCYLQAQIFQFKKLKQMMSMKTFVKTRICLILVNIQKIQSLFDLANNKGIAKMKDEVKGKMISGFLGLNSNMYSLVIVNN